MIKKIVCIGFIALLAACSSVEESNQPAAGNAEISAAKSSCAIKGVADSDLGKVYYTTKHKLYQYVILAPKQGDKKFCSVAQAEKAGFREAPRHFADSMANFVTCLDNENGMGKCHGYVRGVYSSLRIYDKVCGSPNVSSENLAHAVINYTKSAPGGLDMSKYDGTARAMLKNFSCS